MEFDHDDDEAMPAALADPAQSLRDLGFNLEMDTRDR